MKVKIALLFVIISLAGSGCSDIFLEKENFQNQLLTRKFENNKGQFSPIDHYDRTYLSHKKKMPIMSTACPIMNVQMYTCDHGSNVRVVSDGEVKAIFENDYTKFIMVKHGEYYTVYAGLNEVLVTRGDMLYRNTVIGKRSPTADDDFLFRFMIYKNRTQLDPSEWIDH